MAKRTGNSSVNSSIRQQTKSNEEGLTQLLETQQQAVAQLGSIRQLLELSKEKDRQDKAAVTSNSSDRVQEQILANMKEQLKGSRRYWKTQDEFQKEWDKEAKDIAEMAKGMKTFKTMGEKWGDKKEGLKEKFGTAGGLKKTVLGALNVGGIFNKTLARDEFVKKQQALGSKSSVKELKADFAGAQSATKAIQKNESKIQALKDLTGADEDELKVHHPHLFDERQSQTEQLSKYDRGARMFSPDKKNAQMAGLIPKSNVPEIGRSTTATAAEETQNAEAEEEGKRSAEEELKYLKIIAENTGGADKAKSAKPDEKKPEGGGLLDSLFSMLSSGLMNAFKALLNPGTILKALGKVFAIGMIVGALFEGIMDGFDEFMKTGDIGKALIAGLAGIIDFLTFGLFDKEKIKAVIGDMSSWLYDHVIKPYIDFVTGIKDSFLSMIENIGIPKIGFTIPVVNKEVSIGPFFPFKKDANSKTTPEAAAPQTGNIVEQKSADNEGAKQEKPVENKTAVVNAPVTTNNTTTQVIKSPIRNQESSSSRYLSSRYA